MKLLSTILFTALMLPLLSIAAPSDIELRIQRREQRRQERLARTNSATQTDTVRFGRRVIARPFSPRRFRSMSDAKVLEVIDGSLLKVRLSNGRTEGVLILGSNAPIIRSASSGLDCYSQEAKLMLQRLVEGQSVILQKEDDYNRDSRRNLVRYVSHNGRDIGAWMIRKGAAFADRKHDYERKAEYIEMELEARKDDIGLWYGVCDYNGDPEDFLQILP